MSRVINVAYCRLFKDLYFLVFLFDLWRPVQNRTWQDRGWRPRKIFVWLASLASPPPRSFKNSETVNSLGYTWSFQFYATSLGHVCISRQKQITWEFAIALQDSDRKQTNSAKASSTPKKATSSANRKTVRYVFLCWFHLQSNLHGHHLTTGTNLSWGKAILIHLPLP